MPTSELMQALPVSSATFIPAWGQETSGEGSGILRVKDLRPALWRARIACAAATRVEALQVLALIGAMGGALGTFYAWKPSAAYPQSDPGGTTLGGSAVQIGSINADQLRLSLKGLPAGYVLTRGDFLAFDYGARPSRALHQVVPPMAIANGAGVTPEFQVHPPIRGGASVNAAVALVRPAAEMRLVPGTFDLSESAVRNGLSLEAIQVL